jgi:hypothetical protein
MKILFGSILVIILGTSCAAKYGCPYSDDNYEPRPKTRNYTAPEWEVATVEPVHVSGTCME